MKWNGAEQNGGKRVLFSTRMLAILGLLLALDIVLTRFLSITAWNIRIGFGFVPVVLAAMLYGPLPAAIVASLGDFLGAILFPTGPYFPGFTLTAFLTGLTFGLLLYKRDSLRNTVLAVAVVQFVLGLLLNTLWISILYHSPFAALLATRVLQSAFLSVVQIVTIRALAQISGQVLRRVMLPQ